MASLHESRISPASGLCGVLAGAWIAQRNNEGKRRLERVQKQLDEFYGPMLAIRKEILAVSNYRVRVQQACEHRYQEELARWKGHEGSQEYHEAVRRLVPEYTVDVDYFNKRWEEMLWPSYGKMRDLFRDRLSYADPTTIGFYDMFMAYLETQLIFRGTDLPIEVQKDIRTWEKEVHAFYDHLEYMVLVLQTAIKSGKAPGYPSAIQRVGSFLGRALNRLKRHRTVVVSTADPKGLQEPT